jgi:hypothetical protein
MFKNPIILLIYTVVTNVRVIFTNFRVNVLFTFLNIINYARNISDSSLPLKREISPYIITASDISRGFTSDLEFSRTQNEEITFNIRSTPREGTP